MIPFEIGNSHPYYGGTHLKDICTTSFYNSYPVLKMYHLACPQDKIPAQGPQKLTKSLFQGRNANIVIKKNTH